MLRRLTGSQHSNRSSKRSGSGLGETSGATPDGCTANGFATLPDQETFELSEKYIAPFSLPQEALSFEPDAGTLIHTYKSGDRERKIHLNVELREDERELLRQLQEQAKAKGIAFLPSMTVVATRYISQARGNIDTALTLMQKSNEWRLEYYRQPMAEASILEDMRHGIAYFCGRDKCLRPTLVFRAKRIPAQWHRERNYDRVIAVLVFCAEYFLRHMVVPGRQEGLNVLCDLADMGLAQVPMTALIELHKTMGSHYTGRVYKFYICNMSWVLKSLVGVAKKILSDRQNQKLVFVNKKEELREDFALHQLEEDLGGSLPVFKEFLPFPLQAGPFEAGYAGGAYASRVPNVHKALTKLGHRGHFWEPKLSKEENRRLEYTEAAEDILLRCRLPVPDNCPRRKGNEANTDEAKEPENSIANTDGGEDMCSRMRNILVDAELEGKLDKAFGAKADAGIEDLATAASSPTGVDTEDDVIIQDAKVKPGFFPFLCCSVQTGRS